MLIPTILVLVYLKGQCKAQVLFSAYSQYSLVETISINNIDDCQVHTSDEENREELNILQPKIIFSPTSNCGSE